MFTKNDMALLADVFSFARADVVKSNPNNRMLLQAVLNFEASIGGKMVATNEKLGYVEPETEEKEGEKDGKEQLEDVSTMVDQSTED